jgi:hypothetical protein
MFMNSFWRRGTGIMLFSILLLALNMVACSDDNTRNTHAPKAMIEVITPLPHVVSTKVILSASQSEPGDDFTPAWSIVSSPEGSTAMLHEPVTGIAELLPDIVGDYLIELIITSSDGNDSSFALISISDGIASPLARVAILTSAPHVVGDKVLLDGTASEPSSDSLVYSWSVFSAPSGSSASMISLADGLAEMVLDVMGDYVVELTVSNSFGLDTVYAQIVVVEPPMCISNADCGEPAGICDTIKGSCVECLVIGDCAHMPSTVCDAGECGCPGDLQWCAPDNCVDLQSDSSNCGSCGHECFGPCSGGACVDPWEVVTTNNAPTPRFYHTAIWTGTHMIVWGGYTSSGYTNTGGMYHLATNTWTPMNIVNAPSPRGKATAVWTGTHMIIWGGSNSTEYHKTGALFDPVTNSWEPMSTDIAPTERIKHTAVWTGTKMIVWGGENIDQLGSGGIYDPTTDSWIPISPPATYSTRKEHTAVWNDIDGVMIVYGGFGDTSIYSNVYLPSAGVPGGMEYNPNNNSWVNLSAPGEPISRSRHTAIWTGDNMLLWGGYSSIGHLDSGSQYISGTWGAMNAPSPSARRYHTMVWLSSTERAIIWGGEGIFGALSSGAEFEPATNNWISILPIALEGRTFHTAVAAGEKMIIWGGANNNGLQLNSGGIYTSTP